MSKQINSTFQYVDTRKMSKIAIGNKYMAMIIHMVKNSTFDWFLIVTQLRLIGIEYELNTYSTRKKRYEQKHVAYMDSEK